MTVEPDENREVREGWSARLELEVERSEQSSVLGRRSHLGPLRVQRPFYPEGERCPHIYLLHPPGGLVGGDQLETRISIGPLASGLFTTPAAQKLYRSQGRSSNQLTELRVGAGGSIEWFPGESIAFDGARAQSVTRVVLEVGAGFLGWEILCFGRTAGSFPFRAGELHFAFEIYRQSLPLAIDRSVMVGGSGTFESAWGYAGRPVFGSLYAVPRESCDLEAMVSALRAKLGSERASVTLVDQLLVIRASTATVERLRQIFTDAWEVLRPNLFGWAAMRPRIWAL